MQSTPLSLLLLLLLVLVAGVSCDSKDAHYRDADGDGADEHDDRFDQERFLGKDRAEEFAGLDEKASVDKLRKLISDEVDRDKDGFVSEQELVQHLQKMHQQQINKDLELNWKNLELKSEQLDWATYAKSLHPGFFDDTATKQVTDVALKAIDIASSGADKVEVSIPAEVSSDDRILLEEFFRDLVRQRKRWAIADKNSDGLVSKEEYVALLFPDDVEAMRDLMVKEMTEGIDTNGDGRISKEEFIADSWKPSQPGLQEPSWLNEERKEFDSKKDLNGDGFLDGDEVRQWIFDSKVGVGGAAKSEAAHLIREADDDKDARLSVEEIAKHHELFAGSQATNFGEDVELSERDEL